MTHQQNTHLLPFGGYRPGSAPTQTITDRDFTGQKENMELGLLYYGARFYVPGIGRFASADTIVPNPANPQSYNRYSYVENRPLNFNDPSGHCQGSYDIQTGTATQDQSCWDFLYNDFCSGGSIAICTDWFERLYPGDFVGCSGSDLCSISFGENYWTKDELETLRGSVVAAIDALNNAGYNGSAILEGVTFDRSHGSNFSVTFPSNHISLAQVDEMTIWHEIAHAISFRNGHTPQDEYFDFAERSVSAGYFEWDNFCFRNYCATEYSFFLKAYTGNHPEYWADGFAAWVYIETNGSPPDGSSGSPNWTQNSYNPNWQAISQSVEWSLSVTFNP